MTELLRHAFSTLGEKETPGAKSTGSIAAWITRWFRPADDSTTAWCAIWLSEMVSRAGMTPPRAPFRAASWKDWGEKATEPALGDIVVLTRPGSFHVGILLRLTLTEVWLLGGNQNQAVSVARYDASRIVTIRRHQ